MKPEATLERNRIKKWRRVFHIMLAGLLLSIAGIAFTASMLPRGAYPKDFIGWLPYFGLVLTSVGILLAGWMAEASRDRLEILRLRSLFGP